VSQEKPLSRDVAVGAVGAIPILGSILEPLVGRAVDAVRAGHAKNASIALRAAERVSGLTREDLQDKIADNPRLVPLLTRVLFSAGMTGYDEVLDAIGAALGEAVRDPSKVDEAEVLLTAVADLRALHILVLRAVTHEPPTRQAEGAPPQQLRWMIHTLAIETGLTADLTSLCVAGLLNAGLVLADADVYGGPGYGISELGRTVLAAFAARTEVQDPS
jgi:hypothetical protein